MSYRGPGEWLYIFVVHLSYRGPDQLLYILAVCFFSYRGLGEWLCSQADSIPILQKVSPEKC